MIIGPGEPEKGKRPAEQEKRKRKGGKAKKKRKDRPEDPVSETPVDVAAPAAAPVAPSPPSADGAPAAVGVAASAPSAPADPAPRPAEPPVPAGAVVARIDALRDRVAALLAIADGHGEPGPSGPGLADRSPAVPGPTGPADLRVDGEVDPLTQSVDPLTQPVEPIPAAIAAALGGHPGDDAPPGHERTPGVADPPEGSTVVPAGSGPDVSPAAHPGSDGSREPPGPAVGRSVDAPRPSAGAGPAASGPAVDAIRPSASAVLVARELLSGGMAPEGVRARLHEAYGVADPDAALAAAR